MEVYALGSFIVIENGNEISPRASKPRTLLALLVSYSDHITPIDAIIDELWQDNPPRHVMNIMQTYVMQLRQLIAHATPRSGCDGRPRPDPKHILRREPMGYLLHRGAGGFDITEYDRLEMAGNHALSDGDLPTARKRLADAAKLWRGTAAFEDVRTGPRLSAYNARLQESHNTVLERRIEIDLQLGQHHAVLAELAGLVSEQPVNERLRADYAIALYRSGQRTRALAECDQLRVQLTNEFGLEPSVASSALRQAILLEDDHIRTPDGRQPIHDNARLALRLFS